MAAGKSVRCRAPPPCITSHGMLLSVKQRLSMHQSTAGRPRCQMTKQCLRGEVTSSAGVAGVEL